MSPVTTIIWIVSFVVVTVTVTGLSRRVGWSAPIALVAVGAIVSFLPGVPSIVLEPDIVLYGILPPLLFAAASRTSFVDVRARRDNILLLSVGLVAFTVVVVGAVTWLIVPTITLAAALAFGAIVAPTDAVAVTAVAGGVGLPRRLVTVLEGESLLNDATALVALNSAIFAISRPADLSVLRVSTDFVLAVGIGIGGGLLIAFAMSAVRKALRAPVLDTSLSLVTPYLAFIPVQLLHGSGILAVVVAGLYLGYRSPVIQSADARIAESLNWRTIQFLLENAVFLFIGLSLATVVAAGVGSGVGVMETVLICFAILATLLVSRTVWLFATMALYRYGPRRFRDRGWGWRTGTAASFAGIRGVVTLAAAFLLPPETPARSLLQLMAFAVVAGTLVEGLWLPSLIRRLRLPAPDAAQELNETQMLLAEARSASLTRLDAEATENDEERVLERLRANASFLSEALANPAVQGAEPLPAAYNRLRKLMIETEREAVLRARAEGRYQEPAVRTALATIDVEETALRLSRPRGVTRPNAPRREVPRR